MVRTREVSTKTIFAHKQTRDKQDGGIILNTCCKGIWWNAIVTDWNIWYYILNGLLYHTLYNPVLIGYKPVVCHKITRIFAHCKCIRRKPYSICNNPLNTPDMGDNSIGSLFVICWQTQDIGFSFNWFWKADHQSNNKIIITKNVVNTKKSNQGGSASIWWITLLKQARK